MKKILILLSMVFLLAFNGYSQGKIKDGTLQKSKLEKIYITQDVSLHFVSPEPIQYADISTKSMLGDLPVKNVLRIKFIPDSAKHYGFVNRSLGIVTIVGEKFIAQYDVWYTENEESVQTQIEILPKNTNPLDVGNIPMSQTDLHNYALQTLKKGTKTHAIRSSAYGMDAQVNNVYTVDDYVFIDVTYSNNTNLKYDVDEFRFKIDDKRITKATNVQSIEVKPVYQLYDKASFKRTYRNVFAFKKFTFPDNKVLAIELTEKQISGRVITLQLDYSDVLNADTL
ncbi:conjugative transposon protein TraN [Pedobacter antarcticus]|uniref:conjugative transposon protein TraN n=1 Tax=Pedobacter antarcticus TaxID=34086 RepID=UPI0008907E46|nr:conjugative transposon protein TraN [Pedobacter antarcticus]SDM83196.1 Bacteroides conjugative transposon TraN protein [Pedobacter antarcticus]